MELDKAIKERHSVRRFSTKKVDYEYVIEAVSAANLAPFAGNIPDVRFILVNEKDKIEKLAEACQQDFVAQVSYIVVVCSDPTQVIRSYGKRASMYTRQQAGAAVQNFLLKITELGLGTCWVGAFVDEQVRRILNIPEHIDVEAILPIGYELGKGKQRRKAILDNVLFFNTWKNKYMKPWKRPEAL